MLPNYYWKVSHTKSKAWKSKKKKYFEDVLNPVLYQK